MASNGDICSCENCGRKIGYYAPNMVGEIKPPNNAVTSRKGLFVHTFCCDRCKNEWKTEKESSKGGSGGGAFGIFGKSDPEPELSPEQIQAKAEADEIRLRAEAEERRIRDQIEKEELEADKAKAKDLKAEGKKWLALWTSVGKNGRYGIGIGIVVAWFGAFGAPGGIKILLALIAIAGTIFAGLIVKDSMKK